MFDNPSLDRYVERNSSKTLLPIAEAPPKSQHESEANMSGPLYGTRPQATYPRAPSLHAASQIGDPNVSTRWLRLEPGLFSLAVMPGGPDLGTGLPAVRVTLPPGPPGRREAVTISTIRGDGWLTANDEPTLLRVQPGGAEILVTLYWSAVDPAAALPALKLMRVNAEGTGAPSAVPTVVPLADNPIPAPSTAEVVAHIEGLGDVDGKLGDWVGTRGSGRAIEGFSLNPRSGLSISDFAVRAVLGRDWLSPWLPGGSFCGSRGLALPLRGFCLRLLPAATARNELACYARFVDGTEIGPVGSDRICAAANLAALEAFQISLRSRDSEVIGAHPMV
jgi:hypothetical protein